MFALRYLAMAIGLGLFSSLGILVAHDIYMASELRWLLAKTARRKPVPAGMTSIIRHR